ncbi:MAG: LysR family transcriptional regulator, partial [Bdellovibrionales bacterium]|nr:LysR family transcriptional regulator [Bdellovibrionales bacterium]
LGMSRPMVTRYIAELESWSGVRLFQRTTRKLSITEAGEACLHRCKQLLEMANEIEMTANPIDSIPKGRIRVTTAGSFAQSQLTRIISNFLVRYPQTEVELIIADKAIDLIDSKIDIAIRISNELDPGLIAKKLGIVKSTIVATPEYLKRFGKLQKITDLEEHNCLTHSYVGKTKWSFKKKGIDQEVSVSGNFYSNETLVVLEGVLNHLGIAMLPNYLIHQMIKDKKLIPLLTDWQVFELGIYGVYLSKKYTPPAVRAFLDFVSLEIKNDSW